MEAGATVMGFLSPDTTPILLAFALFVGLVVYLLSRMTPARTPVVRLLQVLITVLLSLPIGAYLGAGLGYLIGIAMFKVGATAGGVFLPSSGGWDLFAMAFDGGFLGGLLGLAVGVWRATKLWRHINPTSTARHDAEGLGKKKTSQSDLV